MEEVHKKRAGREARLATRNWAEAVSIAVQRGSIHAHPPGPTSTAGALFLGCSGRAGVEHVGDEERRPEHDAKHGAGGEQPDAGQVQHPPVPCHVWKGGARGEDPDPMWPIGQCMASCWARMFVATNLQLHDCTQVHTRPHRAWLAACWDGRSWPGRSPPAARPATRPLPGSGRRPTAGHGPETCKGRWRRKRWLPLLEW